MSVEKITLDIYESTKSAISTAINEGLDNNKLDILLWFTVISTLMANVEKYKKLSGRTKRQIVVAACVLGVKKSDLKDAEKLLIQTLLENNLPPIIDQAAYMANNVNIQGKIGKFFKKVSHCLCGTIDIEEDTIEPEHVVEEDTIEPEHVVEEEQPQTE